MRSISANGLAKLATRCGNEPIAIVEVDWAPNCTRVYADRDVGTSPNTVPGRIIEIGDLDNVVNVSNNSSSQQINVTLDDTDGTIKAILDSADVHKRDARIYQYFDGLTYPTDRFLLFAGKVSSPISWNERDRTVKFTVISQLEDCEVGFSAEEGQFPYLPADLVGKTWPMIFGVVQDCPAIQVNQAVQGTTLTGVGLVAGQEYYSAFPAYNNGSTSDSNLATSMAHICAQISVLDCAEACATAAQDGQKAQQYLDQINALWDQATKSHLQAQQRASCAAWQRAQQLAAANTEGEGDNPIQILGGEDFPQGTPVTIAINGVWFTGYFDQENFYVSSRYSQDLMDQATNANSEQSSSCPFVLPEQIQKYDYRIQVPCDCMFANFGSCDCRQTGWILGSSNRSANQKSDSPILQQFWADAGATVTLYSDEPLTYIVSIIPGNVLTVKAYKQFGGEQCLCAVPTDLYSVCSANYGSISAVQIVVNKPLSTITDQGWSDDLYVTFQSSVGPDTVNILIYLIENYTSLTWDDSSFNHVQTKLAPFPANFPLLEQKNVLTVLQEIAFQARCALWIDNGKFYIKYLPEEPEADDTITVTDLDADAGVEVELTPTEDLVTKMKITWRTSYAPGSTDRDQDKSERMMILRHNIARYGTQEQDYDWYIYNQPDIIYKAATFWLIRNSSTYKKIKFKTYLQKLNLETFDTVNLNFATGYVANGPVKAVVEQASYSSADNTIAFECLVPVRSGEMAQYLYYWPSALPAGTAWPPPGDVASNDAGGGGLGKDVTGNLPIGDTTDIDSASMVWVGGPNVVFRSFSDWGDRHPSDVGFAAQNVLNTSVFGQVQPSSKPYLNLRTFTVSPIDPWLPPGLSDIFSIDIHKTPIVDSTRPGSKPGRLDSLVVRIDDNGKLVLKSDAFIGDAKGEKKGKLSDVLYVGTETAAIDEDAPIGSELHADCMAMLSDALMVSDLDETLGLNFHVLITNCDGDDDAEFDFQYYSDGNVYGAGTAWLQKSQ